VITELKKKTKYLIVLLLVIQISCSSSEENLGANWIGPADFMHVTKDKMEMTYAVDVVGQKMYLNSFYEVIKKGTETVIFKIKVTDLEFGERKDGISFCRVWGTIDDSGIESYLLAQDCLAVQSKD
tara:strand:+ start:719 stop:1096 length:378 start_codon:yes stop_codon:yes gene_type:complete